MNLPKTVQVSTQQPADAKTKETEEVVFNLTGSRGLLIINGQVMPLKDFDKFDEIDTKRYSLRRAAGVVQEKAWFEVSLLSTWLDLYTKTNTKFKLAGEASNIIHALLWLLWIQSPLLPNDSSFRIEAKRIKTVTELRVIQLTPKQGEIVIQLGLVYATLTEMEQYLTLLLR